NDVGEALVRMIALPDMCSRRWVWEQYDHLIQGNTAVGPGGDAAVIRVERQKKGLAFTLDVTPRYCAADPVEGGKQAVAECWRNLTAVGAEPLAVTDNLNFGNPEKPEIMGQFVGCIEGIGEACRALDFPVVSGNVSLYNETNGKGILPTPAIGGVGLLPDVNVRATIAFKAAGEAILLVGETKGHLGQSIYVRDILGKTDDRSAPPPVDLGLERRNGDFVRNEIRAGNLTAVHDISDGGLFTAVAEMAMAAGIGASLTPDTTLPLHAWAFGEDQARYLVTLPEKDAAAFLERAGKAGIPAARIGTTGGNELTLNGAIPISLAGIKAVHEGWLPAYMAAGAEL
ncbi:MAG: AIR synthase related protein, partial [Henriciella sp.]